MNILVIGQGGREHSIVQAVQKSSRVETIYCAPGNRGMEEATCVPIAVTEQEELVSFAKEKQIDMTIVGPEVPLLQGLVNAFQAAGLTVFGPTKEAALIEGSKAYAKQLMEQYHIPTASYHTCTTLDEAIAVVRAKGAPIVVKADGLAAGKGVTVASTTEEAFDAIHRMMADNQFGEAGHRVVIEQFLEGEEFSLMAFVQGENVYPMIPAQDHKRAFDGDQGPNTGGMGAYAPVPSLTKADIEEAVTSIVVPTAQALVQEGRSFTGILYAGCIQTNNGPKVIEFNARFGDPETQVVLPLLCNDFVQVLEDVLQGVDPQLKWQNHFCAGVVLASSGYPGIYEKGHLVPTFSIDGNDVFMNYAGVKELNGQIVADGGRVLLVGSTAQTLQQAVTNVYEVYGEANTEGGYFYRSDIASKGIKSSSS
ncbi:phosphoribosylamine--glycine ligase [Pontibacillus litoralis]|uniref:Phosphoribosylamine--glycine ligase n=1 Tax=Pontibacillus litoralis JSM 072002 TaxID=1385512 RepID=A0A0A5HX87_9BACI|nr:phosphoribosylamine--glycine ligase [Pontibacillus litoralis]KGX88242.1 phosphoribosylamine--glycine ligase [Pontibacillus litoralis JSM 072002]